MLLSKLLQCFNYLAIEKLSLQYLCEFLNFCFQPFKFFPSSVSVELIKH